MENFILYSDKLASFNSKFLANFSRFYLCITELIFKVF